MASADVPPSDSPNLPTCDEASEVIDALVAERFSDAQSEKELHVLCPRACEVIAVSGPRWTGQALGQCVCHVQVVRPSSLDQRHHSVLDKVPDVVAPNIAVPSEFSIDRVLCNLPDAGGGIPLLDSESVPVWIH
eukprot:3072652-Rhodomonas_salina.1